MPFERPTLEDLRDGAQSEINARLEGADARVRRNNLEVMSRVIAGAAHLLHGRLDWQSLQLFPDTAEAENMARWASIWGIDRRGAQRAEGVVLCSGVEAAPIPEGTELQRRDGRRYLTTAGAFITGGQALVPVRAVELGTGGNGASGTELGFVSPLAGVEATATVDAEGLRNGVDGETDESLRLRLLDRIQRPPQGGSAGDYRTWALEVPGITRAWVAAQELGVGTVTVRVVNDDDPGIVPDPDKLAEVQAHIEARRPVTADVFVTAPLLVPLTFTIRVRPDTPQVRAGVTAGLRDLIRRQAEPGGTLLISQIREAVSLASGEFDNRVLVPLDNIAYERGVMAVFGGIAWSA